MPDGAPTPSRLMPRLGEKYFLPLAKRLRGDQERVLTRTPCRKRRGVPLGKGQR